MTEKVETMMASCARVDRETMASTKKSEKLVSGAYSTSCTGVLCGCSECQVSYNLCLVW